MAKNKDIDVYEVVKRLVGEITPIGETQTDEIRFENLKVLTVLFKKLHCDLDDLAFYNKNRKEFSMNQAGKLADKCLDEVGIVKE